MKTIKLYSILALFFIGLSTSTTYGQRADGAVGIGFQAGQPSGLTVHFFNQDGASLDLLGAWDLDNFFFLNGHAIWDIHLGNSEVAHFYYGPGAFVGFYDENDQEGRFDDGDIDIGLSGRAGFNLIFGSVELFAHVTPRIGVLENTDIEIGGGAGLRFYFD